MDYLVTADSYSGWIVLNTLNSGTSSRMVIQKLKAHFSRFGVPDELYTDNVLSIQVWNLKNFLKSGDLCTRQAVLDFLKVMVERAVQTAKRMPYIALPNLRNTPRSRSSSWISRLQARRLKSKLPTASRLLAPKVINPLTVNEQMLQRRLQQKKYYDKSARPLPSLQTGDQVRVQTKVGHASLGVIKRPPTPEQPRSYIVTVNSKDYRRNRRNLLKVAEPGEKIRSHEESVQEPVREQEQIMLQQEVDEYQSQC